MTQIEYLNQQQSEGCDICCKHLIKADKEAQFYGQHPLIAQDIWQIDLNYPPILVLLEDNTLPIIIINYMVHPTPFELQAIGTPK